MKKKDAERMVILFVGMTIILFNHIVGFLTSWGIELGLANFFVIGIVWLLLWRHKDIAMKFV